MLGKLKSITTKKAILLLLSLLFLQVFWFSALSHADTIKIGLRAHHGIEKSMKQWKQTADYLSEKIPEHKFVIVPFVDLTKLMEETKNNQFDFVLTNPSSYVEMELKFGASAILTLRNKRQNKPYSTFGSVIFTRKDNKKINEIKDLKDKVFIAVSKPAFGGWRVAVHELLEEGFDVYKEAKRVSFSGGIQQDVVKIVGLGNADVGVVRTDMLERMAAEGLIKLDNFKVINNKVSEDFPFARSTKLFPEWPLVKMKSTSSELSKKVALALLTIPSNHPAANAGKYVGWTVPEDYQPVNELMAHLGVGFYEKVHDLEHSIKEHLIEIVFAFVILIILSMAAIYIYITNRKLLFAQQQQDEILNELELRVAERTQDLLVAKEQAEKANNTKTEFLSNMSHELRTPMNAVLGFAQLIHHDAEERKLDEIKENIGEILHAGRHLLSLISDMLDLAEIEEGNIPLDITSVNIGKLISGVIRLLEIQAKENKVTISFNSFVDDNFEIMADQRSIKQVLINIIMNAIKYNNEGGSVNISVEKEQDNYCKISVADDGVGIDEDALKLIFDPFHRVTKNTNIEGSGVGLAVTKNLMEIMNAEIKVESTLGEGSTFILLFKTVS